MVVNSYDSIIKNATDLASDDDLTTFNVFDNFFRPNMEQRAEFGQQVALQQMQNDWSVGGKMQAMKDAGINANVAASGIAGASSPAVGSPNSAVGTGAQGVASAAQAAGALNEAVNAGVNAFEKVSLIGVEKYRKKAEVANLLASAFHNEWLGRAVAEMLPLQKENERADTWLKLANFDKAREEKKLINKRISETESHINHLNKQADLFEKQGNLVDAEKLRVEAQTEQIQFQNDKLQWDKDFREKWHFDNTKPIDNAMIEAMAFEDGDALGAVDTIGKSIELVNKSERKGFNAAEIEDAFDKAYNDEIGKNSADSEFAEFFADVDAWKQIFVDMWKEANENPDNVQGVFAKAMNQIFTLVSNWQVTFNSNRSKSKPNVTPRRR